MISAGGARRFVASVADTAKPDDRLGYATRRGTAGGGALLDRGIYLVALAAYASNEVAALAAPA